MRLLIPVRGILTIIHVPWVPLFFPYQASVVQRCAQQAAQLGPRCGCHVMWSWEARDKRLMVGLLLGLGSVPQQFN